MSDRPKGKHVTIDETSPDALGICDYSGFVFRRKDLIRQMEWRGNALVWTGFLVGRPYLDIPQEQLRPPILPPDPVPVQMPRPYQPTFITWSVGIGMPWDMLTVDMWSNWSGTFDGYIAPPNDVRLSLLQQVSFQQ